MLLLNNMRLLPQETKILAAVELNADRPIAQIRRETRCRDHTIRYYLERLKSRGIIERRPFLNIYPLGYVDYALYFSMVSGGEKIREEMISNLVLSPQVSWIALLGGDFQYGIAICAKHHREVVQFLNRFSTAYPGAFFDKALSLRVGITIFPRKYLGGDKSSLKPVSFGGSSKAVAIDAKDFQILSTMEHHSYSSDRDLARQLGMPISTLEHRLKRLENEGIIAGCIYRVNAALLGMQHFRLIIYGKGFSSLLRKKLYSFAERHRFITYYIECLGDWDYELGVEVEQAENMVAITEEIYRNFGSEINTIKILPVFGHRKITNFPFQKLENIEI